ncbi:MAG: folate-binding protein YgfZ [Marinicellaceae bacterium]
MSDKDSHKNLFSINSFCTCIQFTGTNCIDFLNNLLISDLFKLELNQFNYSALCNPKGRIISSLWISIETHDSIKIICPSNMKDFLINFFNMRKFRLKISISALNNPININREAVVTTSNKDQNTIFPVTDYNGYNSILFNVNFPWIDKENSEKFIPQHVNLDQHENVMSFTKGCYPGQEIIARMKFLGRIKKRMKLVKNTNKAVLLEVINNKNQVSPIIQNTEDEYCVQVIQSIAIDESQ